MNKVLYLWILFCEKVGLTKSNLTFGKQLVSKSGKVFGKKVSGGVEEVLNGPKYFRSKEEMGAIWEDLSHVSFIVGLVILIVLCLVGEGANDVIHASSSSGALILMSGILSVFIALLFLIPYLLRVITCVIGLFLQPFVQAMPETKRKSRKKKEEDMDTFLLEDDSEPEEMAFPEEKKKRVLREE